MVVQPGRLRVPGKGPDVGGNPLLRLMEQRLNNMLEMHGERFFTRLRHPATGDDHAWRQGDKQERSAGSNVFGKVEP